MIHPGLYINQRSRFSQHDVRNFQELLWQLSPLLLNSHYKLGKVERIHSFCTVVEMQFLSIAESRLNDHIPDNMAIPGYNSFRNSCQLQHGDSGFLYARE